MSTSQPEGIVYEEKSQIEWSSAGKQFDLLKTIIAFANCEGGELCIQQFIGDERQLDSARLHDFVAKYVAPAIDGITSERLDSGYWRIVVFKSPSAPHVIQKGANYILGNGQQKAVFYPGQVYVRHGSKSEPAGAEDLQRLIREGVSSWLSSLGQAVGKMGFTIDGGDEGIPFRLVDGGPALEVGFKENHPFSATELGAPFGKNGSWIGRLISKEGMRNNPAFARKHNVNATPIYSYSQKAMDRIGEILENDPDYNPFAKD